MRIALTGATGIAGHPVAAYLRAEGHMVTTLGRRPSSLDLPHVPWDLGATPPDLGWADAVVHAAFDHVPGRYRGGEGDDPAGFLVRNRDGTRRLLDAAPGAKVVFLSSRAVYGAYPPGTRLYENLVSRPDTLYGQLKLDTEGEVASRGGVSLRATGLYGPPPPGRDHKWTELFRAFETGDPVPPRAGTEVHVDDLAAAVSIALRAPAARVLNVSDIVLDRHDLLATYADLTGHSGPLPPRADTSLVSEMDTTLIRLLNWRPRGMPGFRPALRELIAPA